MTTPRIYCPRNMEKGVTYDLGKEHLRYLKNILRITIGERLIIFDGAGSEYDAVVRRISDEGIAVRIIRKESRFDEVSCDVALLQALPKAGKMDFIVQKATELGVGRIIPFISERTVPRLSREKGTVKAGRWRKIAHEAARQCGRASVPEIGEILSLDEVLRCTEDAEVKIIFWEEETKTFIRELCEDRTFRMAKNIAIIIGPEGGFTGQEVDTAREAGYASASIGATILKVDTAVIAALTIIQYERGFFMQAKKREGRENGI